jgi:hypothetical protein
MLFPHCLQMIIANNILRFLRTEVNICKMFTLPCDHDHDGPDNCIWIIVTNNINVVESTSFCHVTCAKFAPMKLTDTI